MGQSTDKGSFLKLEDVVLIPETLNSQLLQCAEAHKVVSKVFF